MDRYHAELNGKAVQPEVPTTEAADPQYQDIDTLSVADLARLMNQGDHSVPVAVHAALDQIIPAIEVASQRLQDGGRLIYVGAGTPGRIGVVDAAEIPPTFSSHNTVIGIIAGGHEAILHAVEGAEDDAGSGAAAIEQAGVGPQDAVIGVAASGGTPFVLGAVQRAQELGAAGMGLSCNTNTALSRAVQYPMEVVVGPEFIQGSTRLKSGTAQKLVLNMFSTISMVRLGKTYGNLMVDVNASNQKLRQRAARIVQEITGASIQAASAALEECDYSVPVASIMIAGNVDAASAQSTLQAAGGKLRTALESLDVAR